MCKLSLLAALLLSTACAAQPVKVEVVHTETGFQLLRDGKPYYVKGVGGSAHLKEAAELGANSLRTWAQGQLEPREMEDGTTRSLLDYAHEQGLTVCAGFWIQKPAHGFDYSDPEFVERQAQECLDWVRKWKDHPAILVWALGNETALQDPPELTFPAINDLARRVKEIDPNHPVMTVTAGPWNHKGVAIREMCPDIDIWGINVYAGLPGVRAELDNDGVNMPYLITEHGPRGHWESPKTDWGAPVEQNSSVKAAHYADTYKAGVLSDPDHCLGSYVFLWGQKQERTETWYGMFLKSGERTQTADEMSRLWTGSYPANRAPTIGDIQGVEIGHLAPGTVVHASVEATDPDGDELEYQWVLKCQAEVLGSGGSYEPEPETLPAELITSDGPHAQLTVPTEHGKYRLFVFVRDGKGNAAYANTPFLVQ